MIKYAFNEEEEYVAVKEDEYDDLTITSDEACRAYQEILRMIDEGWMDTCTEREAEEKFLNTAYSSLWIRCIDLLYRPHERNIDEYWWGIYKSGDLEVLES
ncbi:hypothetical protein Tco_0649879 [Tanacetum coccineum]